MLNLFIHVIIPVTLHGSTFSCVWHHMWRVRGGLHLASSDPLRFHPDELPAARLPLCTQAALRVRQRRKHTVLFMLFMSNQFLKSSSMFPKYYHTNSWIIPPLFSHLVILRNTPVRSSREQQRRA